MLMSYRLRVMIPENLDTLIGKAANRVRASKGAWLRAAIEEKLARDMAGAVGDPLSALHALQGPTADIHEMLTQIASGHL